jgi:hypothetical protein
MIDHNDSAPATPAKSPRRRWPCVSAAFALAIATSGASAQTIDLVGHNGFEQCWSKALTSEEFLQLLAFNTEGADLCIPPAADGSACATSMCTNGSPGCSVTLRAGQYSVGQFVPADGYVQFNASNGFDPFSMPVVIPVAGACTLDFVDTSNVVMQYPLYAYVAADGNAGYYAYQASVGDVLVSGLANDDVAITGGFSCQLANYEIGFYIDALRDQMGGLIAGAIAAETVGQTLCPLP